MDEEKGVLNGKLSFKARLLTRTKLFAFPVDVN